MGTFATTTSLQTLMVGTTFDTATTSLASDCITQAETEIVKILSKRYDISASYFQTSTATPPMLQTISKWLSAGYLYDWMSRGVDSHPRSERLIKRAYENLEAMADYKANLLDSAGSIITDRNNSGYSVQCNTSDYSNTFNEDDELSWAVDTDKLDDIESERD